MPVTMGLLDVHLLRQSGIFSVMEIDTWEVVAVNTYLILHGVHS